MIILLIWYFLSLMINLGTLRAMPPPNPISCNQTICTLQNSYGTWNDRKPCQVSRTVYPTTEFELISVVSEAVRDNLKIKVVSRFSHTIPKLSCPMSKNQSAILISTERYNNSIDIDVEKMRATVDSGVPLRALIDKAARNGLSLVASPYWEGVSVGGVISTGAHGSSWWGRGGSVHDHVIGIRMIIVPSSAGAEATVVSFKEGDDMFGAVKVSLGILGVISKVTFSLEPAFKRSVTLNFTNDSGIEEEYVEHGKKNEFGDIQWYPSRHTAVYRYDNRVPINTSGDGVNDFVGFQSNLVLASQTVRASVPERFVTFAEKAAESSRNVNAKCALASSFLTYKRLIANGLKNNLLFTKYPVIGHQHKIQTSGSCLYSSASDKTNTCAWDPRIKGLFFYESTAIFPASRFKDFIKDVKKLRDIVKPENFCGVDIYNGFLIRFVKRSNAFLGQSEDSIVVDFNYYRAHDTSTPRLNQDVWEEIEQMAFFKYGAAPHWAKNRNLAFAGVNKKYPNFDKFVEAKKALDPENFFSSEWSDELVFGNSKKDAEEKTEGCALEGLCVCSEDIHCSPSKGYFCQRGLVYAEARVCRYSSSSSPSSSSST